MHISEYCSLSALACFHTGGGYRNWKKRYFVLNENALDYYAKHGDPMPKNSIDLSSGRGVRDACDCKLTSWPKEVADGCAFGIATEERTYYLYGFSENDVKYVLLIFNNTLFPFIYIMIIIVFPFICSEWKMLIQESIETVCLEPLKITYYCVILY